jgi:hypothetical protein
MAQAESAPQRTFYDGRWWHWDGAQWLPEPALSQTETTAGLGTPADTPVTATSHHVGGFPDPFSLRDHGASDASGVRGMAPFSAATRPSSPWEQGRAPGAESPSNLAGREAKDSAWAFITWGLRIVGALGLVAIAVVLVTAAYQHRTGISGSTNAAHPACERYHDLMADFNGGTLTTAETSARALEVHDNAGNESLDVQNAAQSLRFAAAADNRSAFLDAADALGKACAVVGA